MNDINFCFVTVDLTKDLDDSTVHEYVENNALAIDVRDNINSRHFDIFFSNDKSLHKIVKNSYKPIEKFNHKIVLKLIASLAKHELDLDLTIDSLLKDDNNFIFVPIFNHLKYGEIVQLLNLTIAQSYLKETNKQEVTICFDQRCLDDYKHYIASYLIDMYTFNTPVPNMQVLPTYAAFSKRVRNFRCC